MGIHHLVFDVCTARTGSMGPTLAAITTRTQHLNILASFNTNPKQYLPHKPHRITNMNPRHDPCIWFIWDLPFDF
jgi:hypothetical protein